MTTLYANGCSFTFGLNLDNPAEQCFANQIKYHIPFNKVVNAPPMGGESNQRIVRTTLDYFLEKINAGEDITKYTALIQFTFIDRWEIYIEEIKDWYRITPQDSSEYDVLYRQYEFNSTEQDLANLILYITALGNFFEKYNIKYMFVSTRGPFQPEHRSCDTYRNYYEICKQYNWYKEPDNSGVNIMSEFEPISNTDAHPSAKSHAAIAKRYAERLIELYPLLGKY